MRTLVDCGCVARVHKDGSGIEIDYCLMHEAAPELLASCRELINAWTCCFKLAPSLSEELELEFTRAGVRDGFGTRAMEVIERVEGAQ